MVGGWSLWKVEQRGEVYSKKKSNALESDYSWEKSSLIDSGLKALCQQEEPFKPVHESIQWCLCDRSSSTTEHQHTQKKRVKKPEKTLLEKIFLWQKNSLWCSSDRVDSPTANGVGVREIDRNLWTIAFGQLAKQEEYGPWIQ